MYGKYNAAYYQYIKGVLPLRLSLWQPRLQEVHMHT